MTEGQKSESIWKVIGLYTADGEFVVNTRIPNYIQAADVVVWGERVFMWKAGRYVEAFVTVVTPDQVQEDIERAMKELKEEKMQ